MPQRPGCVVCLDKKGTVFAEFCNRLVDVFGEIFAFCYDRCNELS